MAGKENKKKELAERYYFDTEFTQEEIAELVGVTPQTMSRWVNDGWKLLKGSYTIKPRDIKNMLIEQIMEIKLKAQNANRTLDNKEADAITKLATSIEKVDRKLTNSTYYEVFIDFNNWLREVDLDLVKKLVGYQHEFVSSRKDG